MVGTRIYELQEEASKVLRTPPAEFDFINPIDDPKEIEKKHGWMDNLSITLYSTEYANWLRNEAYK